MKKLIAAILVIATLAALCVIPAAAEGEGEILAVVVMKPDDTYKSAYGDFAACKTRFIFKNWTGSGINCQWKLAEKTDEGYNEWNCDTDPEIVMADGNHNTTWSEPYFTWNTDSKGNCYFEQIFNIPEALNPEGKTLYELAKTGKYVGWFGDYNPDVHEQNGLVDCDPASGTFIATDIVNGLDVAMAVLVTEEEYYEGKTPVTPPATGDALMAVCAVVIAAAAGVVLVKKH